MVTGYPATSEVAPIIFAPEQPGFVQTAYVKDIVKRAMRYIYAGYPVHLCGPAGTGKSTIAIYLAAQLGRPVVLIHGDEDLTTSDLVGGEYGYRTRKVVDNFVHSVLKTEEDVTRRWVDNRITVACKNGFTLLYDEFTRSRPEANNVLLPILEEKILDLPAGRGGDAHLRVHPDFAAIFTSNPEEYAGVHRAQDALRDRMITINLSHYDRETEVAITIAKGGIQHQDAERIVNIVRDFRQGGKYDRAPTVRACIMIAKVLRLCEAHAVASDSDFTQACVDVLASEASGISSRYTVSDINETVLGLIAKHCPSKTTRKKEALA
ncbi:MAG: gas vesicle protein GvpN [Dehalococcoidales bacterium]|nr:gas vesicle protein GvpN [Dehalococcoidales bacterium]